MSDNEVQRGELGTRKRREETVTGTGTGVGTRTRTRTRTGMMKSVDAGTGAGTQTHTEKREKCRKIPRTYKVIVDLGWNKRERGSSERVTSRHSGKA